MASYQFENFGFAAEEQDWAEYIWLLLQEVPLKETLDKALEPIKLRFTAEWDQDALDRAMVVFKQGYEKTLADIAEEIKDDDVKRYPLEYGKAIHAYTLETPRIYSICSGVMVDRATRATAEAVKDVLVFYKFLIQAVLALPDGLRFYGHVYRAVKWVYPSPSEHTPERHFRKDRMLMWFEPKSTTSDPTPAWRNWFCGREGPRTIFKIETSGDAWRIHKFSIYKEESEVLILPLSIMRTLSATKLCNPRGQQPGWLAGCLPASLGYGQQRCVDHGSPDEINLKMEEQVRYDFGQLSDEGMVEPLNEDGYQSELHTRPGIWVTNSTQVPLCVALQGNVYFIDHCNVLEPGQRVRLGHWGYWKFSLVATMNPDKAEMISGTEWKAATMKIIGAGLIVAATGGYSALAAVPAGAFEAGAVALAGSPWIGVGVTAAGEFSGAVVLAVSGAGLSSYLENNQTKRRWVGMDETEYHVVGGEITVHEDGVLERVAPMEIKLLPVGEASYLRDP